MKTERQIYEKPVLSAIDAKATNSGDPTFAREGFFTDGPEPEPFGPDPVS